MPDLIEKLKALNPTEGEWEFNLMYRMLNARTTITRDDHTHTSVNPIGQIYLNDDASLIQLAPLMRTEILRMDEEMTSKNKSIEKLKKEIKRLKYINSLSD